MVYVRNLCPIHRAREIGGQLDYAVSVTGTPAYYTRSKSVNLFSHTWILYTYINLLQKSDSAKDIIHETPRARYYFPAYMR